MAAEYVRPALAGPAAPDCLILGCTHFPLLIEPIRHAAGPSLAIVDSAAPTADAVHERLAALGLLAAGPGAGALRLLATDGAARFARLGAAFLGEAVDEGQVELVDL